MQFRRHVPIDIIRHPQASVIQLRTSRKLDIPHLRTISTRTPGK